VRWTPPMAFGNTFSKRDGPGAAVARDGAWGRGPSAGRDLELGSRFAAEPAPPRTATLKRPYHAVGERCKRVMVKFRMPWRTCRRQPRRGRRAAKAPASPDGAATRPGTS
jgi:hypothetical protein